MNQPPSHPAEPSPSDPVAGAGLAVAVRNFAIPGPIGEIPVRLYQPDQPADLPSLPVVLYFHGGGFVGGSLDDADHVARHIACHCPAAVLSVAYALAPEKPFPAAPEDAYAATMWLANNAATFRADASRLAVAGDDAGGNLAACVTLIARDRSELPIAAQVLIGPMLDPSMTRLGDEVRLKSDTTSAGCSACYSKYLPKFLQRMHPYAAPLESCRLGGLPPAMIVTAERDVLHNEAEKYAASLIAAGVHTQVARFTGTTHAGLMQHPPMLKEVIDFLRRRLAAPSESSISNNIQLKDPS